jgi:hypothetical protein
MAEIMMAALVSIAADIGVIANVSTLPPGEIVAIYVEPVAIFAVSIVNLLNPWSIKCKRRYSLSKTNSSSRYI